MNINHNHIWTNVGYEAPAIETLRRGLAARGRDLTGNDKIETDIVYGQPPVDLIRESGTVRWVHLDSAGYDRYDNPGFREMAAGRGLLVTNSSSVYAEPCAQHAAALILSLARRLPWACRTQFGDHGWPMMKLRAESRLLEGRNVVLLGFGAIARRLVELLGPFGVELSAMRRAPAGDESIPLFPRSELKSRLAEADDIVNILPANSSTIRLVDREFFEMVKPGANFFNIGRGSTVDQDALTDALESGRLAAACLDVTDPEPLPPDHGLWSAPNCFITPHTAGGHHNERPRLISHFLENLDRFDAGRELVDRIL